MKRNKIGLGLVAILVITALLAGCGGGDITPQPTPTPTPTPTLTPSGETLSETLGMAANIVSVKYDMLMTSPGLPTVATKVWLKKNKMRTEMTQQGMSVVMLLDMDTKTMYSYMPAQNLAMKIPFDPGQISETPMDQAQSTLNYNPSVVGTESIDGKACSVIEYNFGGINAKAWIWKDKGLPLRMEMTSSQGKTIIEYKNIDFSDIPDSMFELPSGVQIMQVGG